MLSQRIPAGLSSNGLLFSGEKWLKPIKKVLTYCDIRFNFKSAVERNRTRNKSNLCYIPSAVTIALPDPTVALI